MFESLSTRIQDVFRSLQGEVRLTEENVEAALREIRMALLEADVNFKVVKAFIDRVRDKAMDQTVLKSLTPAQHVIKIVRDELLALLGGDARPLRLPQQACGVVLLVGAVPLLYSSHQQTSYRNFRVVEDGVLYRSGQLSPAVFERVLREYRIKTVVTLRTTRDPSRPYPDEWEREVCESRGIKHVRIVPLGVSRSEVSSTMTMRSSPLPPRADSARRRRRGE